jgi:predicted peptidase
MRNNFSKILSGIVTSKLSGEKQGDFLSREISLGNENYTYQLYIPPNVESENTPLITFLHGIRERGNSGYILGMFSSVIKQYLKDIPAIIMFPQCRPNVYWTDPRMDEMVSRQIETVNYEFSIDYSRQYLIGVSMGGYGVWHFASQYPNNFAALVSICGGSPLTNGDRFSPIAEKIGKTPAWLFHGSEDEVVQVSESRNMAAAIRKNNGNVKYTEYEGVGHNVYLNAIGDKKLMPWILSQRLDS